MQRAISYRLMTTKNFSIRPEMGEEVQDREEIKNDRRQ
jgi:hypothetical protein